MRSYALNDDGVVSSKPGAPGWKRLLLAGAIVIATLAVVGGVLALPSSSNGILAVVALIAFGVPALWLVWRAPVLGLIALIFLNASFLPASALDVRVGFGGLDLIDLGLVGLLAILIIRNWSAGRLIIPWWRVSAPLLLFVALAILSAIYALSYQKVSANLTFSELRPVIYMLSFVVAAWAIKDRKQLAILSAGLFVVADLVVAVIILQQFRGLNHPVIESVMTGAGRTWLLWPEPGIASGFGSVRVVPAGHVLTYIMSIVAFCGLLYSGFNKRWRTLMAGQWLFLNSGLILTYTRSQWIASLVAMLLAVIAYMVIHKHKVILYFLITLVILLVGLGILGATSTGGLIDQSAASNPLLSRFTSIFTPDETLDTSSLQWRVYENSQAMQAISSNPLLGVGLGNDYRGASLLTRRESVGDLRFARFIHNAYLYIAVKMGIPTILVFAWLCLAFLADGWLSYLRMSGGLWKPVTLALLVGFAGLLFWSNTQPNFMLVEGTLFVGVLMGIVAACKRIGLGEALAK